MVLNSMYVHLKAFSTEKKTICIYTYVSLALSGYRADGDSETSNASTKKFKV